LTPRLITLLSSSPRLHVPFVLPVHETHFTSCSLAKDKCRYRSQSDQSARWFSCSSAIMQVYSFMFWLSCV
jgi:hypothetical protein